MPDLLDIDEARLTQILVNLISNSVKFTPTNGKVKIRAKFNEKKQNVLLNLLSSSEDDIDDEEKNYFKKEIGLQ